MKKYQKAEIIAKNLPVGAYSAGCPVNYSKHSHACSNCECAW